MVMDERYCEEYEEWVETEVECYECEGGMNQEEYCDDDEYTRWSERESLETSPWDGWSYTNIIPDDHTSPFPEQHGGIEYYHNFNGERQSYPPMSPLNVRYEECMQQCKEDQALSLHLLEMNAFSLTSNMGRAFGSTPQVMEAFASDPEFFDEWTMVSPEGEATNPNEHHHYIHSMIFVRTPP